MSLGSELAPHLPTLRRYARLTCGDSEIGDIFVRETLEQIVASPDDFPANVNPKLGLYATFNDVARRTTRSQLTGPRSKEDAWENPKARRLSKLPMVSRQALLLTSLDEFTNAEAAYVLGISEPDVRGLVNEALRAFIGRSRARVLLIGPQSEMRPVSRLVSEMGYQVLGPFERYESTEWRGDLRPALVIAMTTSEVVSSEIVRTFKRPTIFLTSAYEELIKTELALRANLVRMPFNNEELRNLILQALFADLDPFAETPEDAPPDLAFTPPSRLTRHEVENAISARPGPVNAVYRNGQLRLAESAPPASRIPIESLVGLAEDYGHDVQRLLGTTSNLGPSFTARFQKLVALLHEPLTEQSTLRIATQVTALSAMKASVNESLAAETAADVIALIDGMANFARQFPVWRDFLAEAQAVDSLTKEQVDALERVAGQLTRQPDNFIAPELKQAINEAKHDAAEVPQPATRLAFIRAISNSLRALVKFAVDRSKGAGREFNKELEEQLGKLLAKGAASVLVAGSTSLILLAVQLPEFAWLGPILGLAHLTRK